MVEEANSATGKMRLSPPESISAKNTEGFCNTITLEAANIVHNVKQSTNLDGLTTKVGRPTTTVNIPNPMAAPNM